MPLDLNEFAAYHLKATRFVNDKKTTYKTDELHELCARAIEVFSAEPALAKMGVSCVFVGNLHGHFYELLRISSSYSRDNFVFLGNYVDYGSRSVEILSLLLALKILAPHRYQLLRGSHEDASINRVGGFFDELVERFGTDEGEKLFNHFNEVFSWMPLAGVIGEKIFCVHGGLSPHLRSFEDIEKIPRPLTDPMSHPLAANLLWSEPDEQTTGFRIHPKREFALLFGELNVAKFLLDTETLMVVRAGVKVLPDGFSSFAENTLWSIFGVPCFENSNKSASLHVDGRGLYGWNQFYRE